MFIVTSITTRTTTDAKFVKDLDPNDPIRLKGAQLHAARQASAGFVKRTTKVSEDGLQQSVLDVWASRDAFLAFVAANGALRDEFKTATAAFHAAQGNREVSTTATI